jgi:hypothetical protein
MFEYVDPPEPEPECDHSKTKPGDQRTKDFTRRAFWEPTNQAIRTLRGSLRFGRTGMLIERLPCWANFMNVRDCSKKR